VHLQPGTTLDEQFHGGSLPRSARLDELLGRVAGRFARVEPRRHARALVCGLLADLPRRNCWTIAEHAGQATPDGLQHLLAGAVWDEHAVRDDVRDYLVEHLGDPGAVLVVDETGDLKKGTHTVGVGRQDTGTAGKVDNAQVAVYLAYATDAGRGMIDRELYLPQGWTDDPARCQVAGVPAQRAFATKPELARVMLQRALDAGVPAGWVTADEVYGGSPALRGWLEARQAALGAGGQGHRAAAEHVRDGHPGGPAGRAHPTALLAAPQRRPWGQGPPLVRVEPPAAQHGWRAGRVGPLAAGAP
jgi:SRSO17 transposase